MFIAPTPLLPKNGEVLEVLTIGRISTEHQNEENIEAQHAFVEAALKHIYKGRFNLEKLGECASGMLVDRPSINEAMSRVAGGGLDLIMLEELSRAVRNPAHQYAFVQHCVDHETRCICLNDNLDTADENWEVNMGCAALRHGLFIPETRKRIKRTATHAFNTGGMVLRIPFGFRRVCKEEADSCSGTMKGVRLAKDPNCTSTIREMADRVVAGESYGKVADWLNKTNVKPGSYVTSRRWTGKLVREYLRNDLLHGERTFRKTLTTTEFKTGRRRSSRNTSGTVESNIHPELAHLTPAEHRHLLAAMDERAKGSGPRRRGANNVRYRLPRCRTVFPRQHARCGICGSFMYPVDGKGLLCSRALVGDCWNRVRPREALVRHQVLASVMASAKRFSEFEPIFVREVRKELRLLQSKSIGDVTALEKQLVGVELRISSICDAIEDRRGSLRALTDRLADLERRRDDVADQIETARATADWEPAMMSEAEIRCQLSTIIQYLAGSSHGFSDLMRRLIPVFEVYPVQALDTGQVRARAGILIRWSALTDETSETNADTDASVPVEERRIVDLFETPQHIEDGLRLVDEGDPGGSLRRTASVLPMSKMRVKRARAYAKLMIEAGTSDPFRTLTDAPTTASRWGFRRRSSAS